MSEPSTSSASIAPTKLSFSFKSKSKPPPKTAAPQPSAFASFDDDQPSTDDIAPDAKKKGGKGKKANGPISLIATSSTLTKAQRREMEEQKRVDATVYEYDSIYDSLKEAERRAEEKKEEEAKIRQPRYIGNLLQAASQRKRDHLIAEEKMIQREREAEGDEFADKEKFVTQAYKDLLEENRKAEEEEKRREELAKKEKKSGPGLTTFYASLLAQSDAKHTKILEASKEAQNIIGPTMPPNLTIRPPDQSPSNANVSDRMQLDEEPKELTDLEIARRARAEGKEVELNEQGEIIDKRQLLSAGLNLSAPNTRNLSSLLKSKSADHRKEGEGDYHRAVGSAASKKEIDARRRREVERQLKEEEERKVEERERAEREEKERGLKRRNDEATISSARERYLERKRRKLEEKKEEEEEES